MQDSSPRIEVLVGGVLLEENEEPASQFGPAMWSVVVTKSARAARVESARPLNMRCDRVDARRTHLMLKGRGRNTHYE